MASIGGKVREKGLADKTKLLKIVSQLPNRLKYQIEKLPGDMLLIACFISYVGSFTNQYRIELQENIWKPTFRDLKVGFSLAFD